MPKLAFCWYQCYQYSTVFAEGVYKVEREELMFVKLQLANLDLLVLVVAIEPQFGSSILGLGTLLPLLYLLD